MFTKATLSIVLVAVLTSLFVAPTCLPAQDEDKAPAVVDELAIQQGVVADKYARLEKLLYDMARIEQVSNPRRASLLMQALKQSKEKLTVVKLNAIVKQLNQEKLDLALENQRDAHKDMIALLQLLLSESRSDRNKKQQELIREYIKEVQRIKRLQSANQGRTEGGAPMGELAKDQGKIADRTDQLAKRIQENEEGGAQGEGKPTDEPKNAGDGKGKGKGKGKGEGEGKGKG
nr:hypothetical protein [Planctomycetota bacterium]